MSRRPVGVPCPGSSRRRRTNGASACSSLFADIAGEHDGASIARAQSLAALAMLIAGRVAERLSPQSPPAGSCLVRRFEGLVEANLRALWSVARYAAALGVCSTHLSRVCRSAPGAPAGSPIAARVMTEARRLLADTGHSVDRIADDLGFADPAYVPHAFTRSAWRTPTAFRNAIAGSADIAFIPAPGAG